MAAKAESSYFARCYPDRVSAWRDVILLTISAVGGNSSGFLGGSTATIGPGDPNAKKNYCSQQADQAALEDLLPGITRGDYVSTASQIGVETGAHLALEGAAASSVLKRSIRARTGIAMSTTSKWLGRISTTLLVLSGYEALRAAQKEYQACMNY